MPKTVINVPVSVPGMIWDGYERGCIRWFRFLIFYFLLQLPRVPPEKMFRECEYEYTANF